MEDLFEKLSQINCNDKTENKNGLTYLSWTWAWSIIKSECPEAYYEIKKFGEKKLPYVYDENTGYMVFTEMTIGEQSYEMWLPVMDGNNKAMLNHEYTYKVKEYVDGQATGKYIEKTVAPATMFDINKTIMRCLVKNIAMFGLGIYIYAGEDYPEGYEMSTEEAERVVIGFGKYKGQTLKQIKETNESYLYWIIDSETASQSLKEACSKLVDITTLETMPITEAQKQRIKDEIDKETIKAYLVDIDKKRISDLTFEEANDLLEINEKNEEEVF